MALTQDTNLWYARGGMWKRAGRYDHTAGAVIGGYYKQGNGDIRPDIAAYNMNINGHTLYVSWAQGVNAFPQSAWVEQLSQEGMMMNYVWEPKVYGAAPPAQYASPNGNMAHWGGGVQFYSWTQVTSGALDQLFDDVADKVKTLPYNINIQICSERDTDHEFGGTINGVSYTRAQLDTLSVPAITYIINRFKARGVTNATFSAGMGGFDHDSFIRCYCADVDFIQYNAYNHNTWQTADAVFQRTYNWLSELPAGSETKPVWIAEWGCDADTRRPAWLRSVPTAIAKLPRIKFFSYFNSGWGMINASDTASMQALADCFDDYLFGGTG